MPCLSGRYDHSIGPLINVGILPPGTLTPSGVTTSASLFPALLDTGASGTCISLSIASTLGLTAIGMRPMTSATHAVPMNVYLVDLAISFGAASLGLTGIQVMEFTPPGGSPFQVLIGRDIICRGVLTVSFDGHFSFCL